MSVQKKHILIVDNDNEMLNFLALTIEFDGYRVSKALNGMEALETSLAFQKGSNPIDLLITDMQTPYLSGFDLIDGLHTAEIFLPTIIMSSEKEEETAFKLDNRDVNKILQKPINVGELLHSIKKAFHQAT